MLDEIGGRWNIDRSRLLLTGMSDGGTYTYVWGLRGRLPVHAPRADRRGLPSDADDDPGRRRPRARPADPYRARRAGLDVLGPHRAGRGEDAGRRPAPTSIYREIADLSHTYPRDENGEILDWFLKILLIGVGSGWRRPLPPNRTSGFPAYGSPVGSFLIGSVSQLVGCVIANSQTSARKNAQHPSLTPLTSADTMRSIRPKLPPWARVAAILPVSATCLALAGTVGALSCSGMVFSHPPSYPPSLSPVLLPGPLTAHAASVL